MFVVDVPPVSVASWKPEIVLTCIPAGIASPWRVREVSVRVMLASTFSTSVFWPDPPIRVLLPVPPVIVLLPPPPSRSSLPGPPISVSSPGPP